MGGAHRRACELYRMEVPADITTVDQCMDYTYQQAVPLLQQLVARRKRIKVSLVVTFRFSKVGQAGEDTMQFPIRSQHLTLMLYGGETVRQQLRKLCAHIHQQFEDFTHNGSGWVMAECESVDLEVGECLALSGSSSGCHTLHLIKGRRGRGKKIHDIVTVQGESSDAEDHRCFYRALAASQLYQEGGEVPTLAEIERYLAAHVHEVVPGPVEVQHIETIERANSHLDISVNVVCRTEDDDIFPVHSSRRVQAKNIVNLLLFHTAPAGHENDERCDVSCKHYAWVENLPQYLAVPKALQHSSGGMRPQHNKHLCYNCFSSFSRESTLLKHVSWCHEKKAQRMILPEPGEKIEFEPKNKSMQVPYCFVYDFECYMATPVQTCKCSTAEEKEQCTHKTKVTAEHVPFAYSYLLVDRDGQIVEDQCYVGEDCAEHFIQLLLTMEQKYLKPLQYGGKGIDISPEEEAAFQAADECYLCEKPLAGDKCRDHCHMTGRYLGAAHNRCNFLRRESFSMVGFCHNQAHYDGNILVQAVAARVQREKESTGSSSLQLSAIPLNTEHFKCLKINSTMLLDSMSFLGDSLDRLVQTLVASHHTFPLLKQWLPEEKHREMLMRKGVYPYEFVTSLAKVENTRALPEMEQFYSKLSGSGITAEEHAYAKKVWETFGCASLRDYTMLYCRTDAYLLAEAITELRDRVYAEFELDICHYMSLPQLSKDMFLKSSGMQLELVSDIDMIEFFRANIRGGLSYVNQRYASKEEETVNKGKPVQNIYVDANNLYGAAMRLPMPVGEYKWMTGEEMQALDPQRDFSMQSDVGYVCEVTLEYPPELHELHSSFPLAPHQMEVTEKHLSPYARQVKQVLTGQTKHRASKLTSTFLRREKYVCHGLNLRLYLDLGLKLVEWHRGVRFKQSPFIRDYIEMCARKRAAAPTKSMANFFKLAANSLYGEPVLLCLLFGL